MADRRAFRIKLQLFCGDEIAMGPGKADLLDAITAHGSISAAARALGMSYRRAWLLVDIMNRCWAEPLVATTPGGVRERGARLTPGGAEVLRLYRSMQDLMAGQVEARSGTDLLAILLDAPRPARR
ncbi:LysR family transcriptional regulator [Sphingomonas sp. CL5.1]|uniref:winged helix-turn-helix domain-containing protein n=1 Tax=Sphingomonas sp. CL5.1 TaxID=2653203 RepID=UPI001581BCD8|nr:LysR family transcriptional regulator [Sphingomonas sp. CL5.1]QKS01290.1 LysR family transcriptional regulator [Sphingomonas sp. CL5.1]